MNVNPHLTDPRKFSIRSGYDCTGDVWEVIVTSPLIELQKTTLHELEMSDFYIARAEVRIIQCQEDDDKYEIRFGDIAGEEYRVLFTPELEEWARSYVANRDIDKMIEEGEDGEEYTFDADASREEVRDVMSRCTELANIVPATEFYHRFGCYAHELIQAVRTRWEALNLIMRF